jgi:hypothetical protein
MKGYVSSEFSMAGDFMLDHWQIWSFEIRWHGKSVKNLLYQ